MQTPITSYEHAMELIQAALPYANSQSKTNMEILIKAGELAKSISSPSSPKLSACDIPNQNTDLEGLFLSLQKVSTPNENELLNSMLNFIQTRKLYQSYLSAKDSLPPDESGKFTRNQLFPLIENFFKSHQNKEKGELTP